MRPESSNLRGIEPLNCRSYPSPSLRTGFLGGSFDDMFNNLERYHRRSIRLEGYGYALPGSYFITICMQNRYHLFGEIAAGAMQLNPAGQMVSEWWMVLNQKFASVETTCYVVMPNHVHGIMTILPEPIDVVGGSIGDESAGVDEHGGMGEHLLGIGEHGGSPLRVSVLRVASLPALYCSRSLRRAIRLASAKKSSQSRWPPRDRALMPLT